jgi:transketolase
MNAVTDKKPRLTTSAMIASIASEGQRVKLLPLAKPWWPTLPTILK